MNEKEQGDYVRLVRGVTNNEYKEKTSNRYLLIWFTNIDTLTQDKLHEITWRKNQAKCKPDVIALVEGKPKNSRAEWNPVWHEIQNYNIESINMNPSDQGRGILVYINENIWTKISLLSVKTYF